MSEIASISSSPNSKSKTVSFSAMRSGLVVREGDDIILLNEPPEDDLRDRRADLGDEDIFRLDIAMSDPPLLNVNDRIKRCTTQWLPEVVPSQRAAPEKSTR